MIGESRVTNSVLKMLGTDVKNEIDNYINDVCNREFVIMNSIEQVREVFNDSLDLFMSSLTQEDLLNLRSYTGYNFKNINSLLRGNWNYENNGILTEEKEIEFRKLSAEIKKIINKFNIPYVDFMTFRGTTLDSFASYGIKELSQLENLKNKFMYEQGFTSTSILKDTSYFDKRLDDGRFCNIGIRYLIPAECEEGVLLIDNNTSYSTGQNEFLLNSGLLCKVVGVEINTSTNTAVLTVVLIPKKIYDLNYKNEKKNSK